MILKELLVFCDDGNASITIVREDGMIYLQLIRNEE